MKLYLVVPTRPVEVKEGKGPYKGLQLLSRVSPTSVITLGKRMEETQ